MRWDEEVYGREYDLDIYMIVAVSHFNMGAMENKGLNIFNTSCVLAISRRPPLMQGSSGWKVIAREYFHNLEWQSRHLSRLVPAQSEVKFHHP
ncbi:MAG: M1 family aminopeptidase [Gammaproteobacteria bacterium]